MTKQQIKNKISELDYWLTNNAHHTNYTLVLKDKKELEQQLITLEQNEQGIK
ncbi:hypothetical protein MYRA21_0103 [Myroides sp. A21]|uniref:hypothetical protein n=1 Tax=Myroides sp. A21 TaxID=1583100 RepID=UPI0005861B23|nr:hypothetical protein [Myroides sp. A21]AJA67347.1 hypothetical protein MYRA21_0103 [Myroides sp. A21]